MAKSVHKKGPNKQNNVEDAVREIEVTMESRVADAEKKGKKGTTKAQLIKAIEAKEQHDEQVKQELRMTADRMEARQRFPDDRALQAALLLQQEVEERQRKASLPLPLPTEYSTWKEVAPKRWVRFGQFDKSNKQMDWIVGLYNEELSEPYSSFTYQFFVFGWPDLCILAYGLEQESQPSSEEEGNFIGACVSRVSSSKSANRPRPLRGYVAMLAVEKSFRGARIGSRLVEATVALMKTKGCDEVGLETPVNNQRALKLYTDLGFAKIKFLPVYYLDGSDAYRLKLYLTDFTTGFVRPQHTDDDDENAVPKLEEQQ